MLRLWAPKAELVDVVLEKQRLPMAKEPGGWWSANGVRIEGGYRIAIDGATPVPDPRSPSQPCGVFGSSAAVDHAAFRWTDQGWQPPALESAVIYELHIGTFSRAGTFDGAIEHLDHLARLGVTHVEIMPVAEFSGTYGWGYDGVFLFAPHHAYGGPDALKRLVDACHARGLAVLLDVVYNHFGPVGNVTPVFGPYTTDRHRTPWGDAVNLDGPGSDEVRRFFIDNAQMWLRDYHMDGLRLDAVHTLIDASAVPFLEELALEVEALSAHLGRRLVLIAESDLNDPRLVRESAAGGFGLHAHWCDDMHHALHAALTGEKTGYYEDYGSLDHVARALTRGYVYEGQYSPSRARRHGRPAGLSGHKLVACLQNHDQIGNRARGDRLSMLVSQGLLKAGVALLLLSPFVPLLFQGEEWGARTPFHYFAAHEDASVARSIREGRRREFAAFGWKPEDIPDPMSPATFAASRLDWNEPAERPHAEMLEWYRCLLSLRRAEADLTDGRFDRTQVRVDEQQRWIVMRRGAIVVAANLSGEQRTIPDVAAGEFLAVSGHARFDDGLAMGPESVAVMRV